jgi:hypothetical protein
MRDSRPAKPFQLLNQRPSGLILAEIHFIGRH